MYYTYKFLQSSFGEVLLKVSLDAWVNEVAWSPDSKTAVIAAQDSTLTFINLDDKSTSTLNLESSPITKITFINNKSFIGVAFDRHFYLFEQAEGTKWYLIF